MTDTSSPTAGWYPAPHANGELRYWDGTQWVDAPAAEPESPKKRKLTWLWVTLGIIGGIVVLSGIITAINGGGSEPAAQNTPADNAPAVIDTEPEAPALEPEPPAEPEQAPEPELTAEQRNAVSSAQSYLAYTAFSREGLIKQLEFEGFSHEAAVFAVDHVSPDWNEQAVASAKAYLDYTSFSRQGLVDQLIFEGFTPEQAEHGVSVAYQ